ncbi:hypothetical protein FIBSPDRAFT_816048 [Athelia psychrophila]|uniref:T6SS Phospholipase effector Tle1-like catalytic domain-containing protein n=1 Tax=Athelia psychrophila TaxID=1759441 RepID=A0A166SL71_9AGAM|nr:hypothetical protein FIBSPDRAFT_816048 [Fibularhizoctonia sp. CBS 109695]
MPDQASQTFTGVQKAPNGQNLVLTVDGTLDTFGFYNTNIIELYSRLEASDKQCNYYNSGVGTRTTKPNSAWKWITQNVDNAFDLPVARNFEKVILAAYRWLSERYKPGDRIFLFGFSRGAYQMRVLAAMIAKVGLMQGGNEEQIPLCVGNLTPLTPTLTARRAFKLYKTKDNERIACRFKDTFCMKDVGVHFLGVWDAVSSVGLVGNKILPMVDEWEHIGIFRHALALDERRVRFIPECVMRKKHRDKTNKPINFDKETIKISTASGERIEVVRLKEVWFAGSHSDVCVGGGNLPNDGLNLESAPLLWMVNEAAIAGLLLTQSTVEWKVRDLETAKPHRSLHSFWWALECLPLHRQSRSSRSETSHW